MIYLLAIAVMGLAVLGFLLAEKQNKSDRKRGATRNCKDQGTRETCPKTM